MQLQSQQTSFKPLLCSILIVTVTIYITQCIECQLKKNIIFHKIKLQRYMMFTSKTNYAMALLYINHSGKLPRSDKGNECILICRDNFTSFIWLIPVTYTRAETVLQALEDNIFKNLDYQTQSSPILLDPLRRILSKTIARYRILTTKRKFHIAQFLTNQNVCIETLEKL